MADPTNPPTLGSLAALKSRLGIPAATITKDDDLTAALVAATASILGATGLQFLAPVVQTVRGAGRPLLFLKAWPVVSVDSVTPGFAYPAPDTPLDGRTYQPDSPDGRYGVELIDGSTFQADYPYRVAYTAGIDPANVPADLAAACVEVAAMRQSELGRIGKRSETLAGQTVAYDLSALSPSASAAVARWSRAIW